MRRADRTAAEQRFEPKRRARAHWRCRRQARRQPKAVSPNEPDRAPQIAADRCSPKGYGGFPSVRSCCRSGRATPFRHPSAATGGASVRALSADVPGRRAGRAHKPGTAATDSAYRGNDENRKAPRDDERDSSPAQLAKSRGLMPQILSARKSLPAVRMRDWRACREIIVIWDCVTWRRIPQAVYNLAEELADAPRIHCAGDPHLEHNRRGWRERCRMVDHLTPAAFTLTEGTMRSRRSSFAFVSGIGVRFRLPDAQARLE